MKRIWRHAGLCAMLVSLFYIGCGRGVPISFDVSSIVRDETGTIKVEGPSGSGHLKKPPAAGTSVTVRNQGKDIAVKVADVKSRTIVFEVSHPDFAAEQIEVSSGETKDVFPGGDNLGVRILVKEP